MLTGDAVISDRTSFCICVQHNAGSLSPCMVSFSCRCTTTALYFGFWFQILLDFVTFEPFWPCTCHIRVQFPDFCGPWRVVNYFPSKMTFLVYNNYLGLPFLHLRTIADDLTSRRAPSRYIENNTGNRESSCWVPIVVSKLCDKGLPTPIERDVLASSKWIMQSSSSSRKDSQTDICRSRRMVSHALDRSMPRMWNVAWHLWQAAANHLWLHTTSAVDLP